MPQVRLTFGVDYEVTDWTYLVLNPLTYWYSESPDDFVDEIDGLSGFEAMAGISHLFGL